MRYVYGIAAGGEPFLMQYNDDGTAVLYALPAGAFGVGVPTTIPLAECRQGLYGPDGVLIASCNDG